MDNTYDQSGHLLSSGTDERAEPARSQGGSYLGKSASGCRELTVKFTSTTVINTGTITYGQTKRWCWSANKVTGPNGSGAPVFTRYVCCNATNVKEVSWSPYSYFFQYDGLGPNSGHFSQVNGKFTICLGSLCADQYPYINIETHGNGTYSWYWYDGDYN
ncbi:hypothetical protein AB0J74_21010 [Asanoa sp. NPDC049573]|uniref:hypothetical protein n=1 Tax=Asanoa sp. NPDC049573 TaxID=3155396 RepID=UPI003425ED64